MAAAVCLGIYASSIKAWYAYAAAFSGLFLFFFELWFPLLSSGTVHSFLPRGSILCRLKSFGRKTILLTILFSVFILFSFIGGFLRYSQTERSSSWIISAGLDQKYVQVTGRVESKELTSRSACIILNDVRIRRKDAVYYGNRVRVSYYLADSADKSSLPEELLAYKIGNVIRVKGQCACFQKSRNPGNFDQQQYYEQKRTDFTLYPNDAEVLADRENSWKEGLFRIKYAVRNVFMRNMPEDMAGSLSRMTLGDSSLLNEETKEIYQVGGISHILAISGLHISIVGMLLYKRMRKKGLPYGLCGLVCGFLVFQYAAMSGFSVSSRRACGMFLIMLFANAAGEAYDSLSALSLTGMAILLVEPMQLFSPSFQLSFLAVLGAVLLPGIWDTFFEGPSGALRSSFLLCCSVQLTTLPCVLYYFFRFPVYGILVNLILVPFMGILLLSGLCGGLVGLFVPPLSFLLLLPAKAILLLYRLCLIQVKKLPYSSWICGQPPAWKTLVYYLVLFLICFFLSGHAKKRQIFLDDGRKKHFRKKNMRYVLALAAYLYGSVFFLKVRPSAGLEISMLDVGQGEGIFIRTPYHGCCFIDGGSTDIRQAGKYRIEPFLLSQGVGNISWWFVSHTDEDHISGLEELLQEGYPIDHLVLAEGMVKDEDSDRLIREASANGTEIVFLDRGDQVVLGDLHMECVFPDNKAQETDKNEACLVLQMNWKNFRALFPGDASKKTEQTMIRQGYAEEENLLQAAHHGSNSSSCSYFLNQADPDLVLISAGIENVYGHPAEETLRRLEKYTDRIYTTKDTGCIRVFVRHGRIKVITMPGI